MFRFDARSCGHILSQFNVSVFLADHPIRNASAVHSEIVPESSVQSQFFQWRNFDITAGCQLTDLGRLIAINLHREFWRHFVCASFIIFQFQSHLHRGSQIHLNQVSICLGWVGDQREFLSVLRQQTPFGDLFIQVHDPGDSRAGDTRYPANILHQLVFLARVFRKTQSGVGFFQTRKLEDFQTKGLRRLTAKTNLVLRVLFDRTNPSSEDWIVQRSRHGLNNLIAIVAPVNQFGFRRQTFAAKSGQHHDTRKSLDLSVARFNLEATFWNQQRVFSFDIVR